MGCGDFYGWVCGDLAVGFFGDQYRVLGEECGPGLAPVLICGWDDAGGEVVTLGVACLYESFVREGQVEERLFRNVEDDHFAAPDEVVRGDAGDRA